MDYLRMSRQKGSHILLIHDHLQLHDVFRAGLVLFPLPGHNAVYENGRMLCLSQFAKDS
jgi:hypothetical protein